MTVAGGSPWVGHAARRRSPRPASPAIFALLAVRTSGVYFLLLTLALGMIVWGVCLRWTSVTGGENGMRGIVRARMVIADPPAFYYFVLAIVVADDVR